VKIEGTSIPPIGGVQAAAKAARINKSAEGSKQDNLAVSEQAKVFQRLLDKVKALPDVREDKVKEFSEKIARGEFNLEAESIAASILAKKTGG